MRREPVRWIAVFALVATACSYNPPDDTPLPDGGPLPVVTFQNATSLIDENVATHKIRVQISEDAIATVDYRVSGGNATPGVDFTLAAGIIDFSSADKDIEIMISSDGQEEGNETVEIELSNPQGATLGTQATHVVTISADILPRVRLPNAATQALEDLVAGAKLDLALDIAPTSDVSIDIAVSGSATPGGGDHTLAAQTVTFAMGSTTAQLDYGIVLDARDEPNQIISVDLVNPVGVVIDTTAAHTDHTIEDDDDPPTVAFTNATNTQTEGNLTVDQTVELSIDSEFTVTVQYAASGNAGATDVTVGGNGTLTFLPGDTSETIPIAILTDDLDEGASETATITLSAPSLATLGSPSAHTLTITDDDDPPTFTFKDAATAATETGTALATTVTLSAPSGLTVTIDFTIGGTANEPGDFTNETKGAQRLTFQPGETTRDIEIAFVDNAAGEVDETIVFTLTSPVNATPGAITVHTVTITDDDCFGAGNFRVCPTTPPTGNKNLTAGFSTDGPDCEATQPVGWTSTFGQPASCFVLAGNITIPGGGLQVTGTRPLVLVASGTITISGVLDASANGATHGPGGISGQCDPPSNAENHADGGGGGAGASFMSRGGNGGDGDASDNNADGGNAAAAEGADPTALRSGCAGQTGGTGPGAGGTGGGAGGAVYLVGDVIEIAGTIDVSGSGGLGGINDAGAGGGGGAGGMIVIDALTTLTFDGVLMSNGGGGGQGADNNSTGGNGIDPSSPTTQAAGGNNANNGGAGGAGFCTGAGNGADPGIDGLANQGAGGGGGGGGFIRSTRSLATGTTSAGKVVAP